MDQGLYGRKDRLISEKHHDAYRENGKYTEPTICTGCGAIFMKGRWSWKKTKEKVSKNTCPACRRSMDDYPAGEIELRGNFFLEHGNEILNLIRNVEKQEKGEHPLERIMMISTEKNHTLVTTTGVHIARRIGEALSRSYQGDYKLQYAEKDNHVKISWQR